MLHAALKCVDPASLVARALGDLRLPEHRRLFLLGLGKAAVVMTRSAAEHFDTFAAALIVTKFRPAASWARTTVMEAGHPVPDHRSLAAGRAVLEFVSQLEADDLLICLISGGASALVTAPVQGVSLEDLQRLTTAALASGAAVEELNVLRRQLDGVKGGGLAAATKASVVGLILSDVIGDRAEAVGSGPTSPNPTGPKQAIAIVRKRHIQVSASLERALRSDLPRARASTFDRVKNIVIGNVATATNCAFQQARQEGFSAEIISTELQGEAQNVGRTLATTLVTACHTKARPFCLLAAGETTVTLSGNGMGGRNQELALAAVDMLADMPDCILVSLATDGNDGPTDAAGAVVTGASRARAARLGMSASGYLARHDAYPFFAALGDLLRPGPTGTNVNDLILLLGL